MAEAKPVLGVIFDCDGTLMDSMGLWLSMEDRLSKLAGHELSKDEEDMLRACTLEETSVYLHEQLGVLESPEAVMQAIMGMARDYYASEVELRPGALEFVQALCERGIACSIASSSPQSLLQSGVAHTGLDELLCAVVSTDDVQKSKRESAVYDRARGLMGTPLDQTWVFEDAAYTFATTVPAGYRTVGIYDRDESGTYEELEGLADVAIRGYADLDFEHFVEGLYART